MIFTFHTGSNDIAQGDAVKIIDSMKVDLATANTDDVIGIATIGVKAGADVPVQLLGDVSYGWAGENIAAPQNLTPTTAGSLAIATGGQNYFYVALCDALSGEMVICMNKVQAVSTATNEVEDVNTTVSFETGEQTSYKIWFPYACTVNKILGVVVKAIAGTDNGTITGANSSGNSTNGVITCTAGDALGTEYSVSPTTNNTVAKDSYYKLTTAKTTAGGKVLITLQVSKT